MKKNSTPDERAKGRAGWFARMGLKDALARGGCPLCQALGTSLRRYLFSFLYEGMMSCIAREEFLKGGGFCQQHFWQAKWIEEECWADGFGISILCENLISRSLKDLEVWTQSGKTLKTGFLRFRKPAKKRGGGFNLIPGNRCIACVILRSSEEHYLGALEDRLEEPDFADRYNDSPGLCLRHLQTAAERWQLPAALELVKVRAQHVLHELLAELREFQRKHDYQYKHEPRGSEWSSPERTIDFLVGPRADLTGFKELQPTRRTRR